MVEISYCIAYSPDGKYFACGEDAGTRLWTASGGVAGKLQSGEGLVISVAFSPDSARIAAGTLVGAVCIWHTATRVLLSTLPRTGGPVYSLAFSPDGTRLALAGGWGTVRVWNFSVARYDLDLGEGSNGSSGVAFTREGYFLVGSRPGTVCIWDARTGNSIGEWPGGFALVGNCMSVSPDGRSLAARSGHGDIIVWDMLA